MFLHAMQDEDGRLDCRSGRLVYCVMDMIWCCHIWLIYRSRSLRVAVPVVGMMVFSLLARLVILSMQLAEHVGKFWKGTFCFYGRGYILYA